MQFKITALSDQDLFLSLVFIKQVHYPVLRGSSSFEEEKSELEIYFSELHVSMFAPILKTCSYSQTINSNLWARECG